MNRPMAMALTVIFAFTSSQPVWAGAGQTKKIPKHKCPREMLPLIRKMYQQDDRELVEMFEKHFKAGEKNGVSDRQFCTNLKKLLDQKYATEAGTCPPGTNCGEPPAPGAGETPGITPDARKAIREQAAPPPPPPDGEDPPEPPPPVARRTAPPPPPPDDPPPPPPSRSAPQSSDSGGSLFSSPMFMGLMGGLAGGFLGGMLANRFGNNNQQQYFPQYPPGMPPWARPPMPMGGPFGGGPFGGSPFGGGPFGGPPAIMPYGGGGFGGNPFMTGGAPAIMPYQAGPTYPWANTYGSQFGGSLYGGSVYPYTSYGGYPAYAAPNYGYGLGAGLGTGVGGAPPAILPMPTSYYYGNSLPQNHWNLINAGQIR